MSQSPPPPFDQPPLQYGYAPASRQTNGPAIASLILGIVGCIPFLTGILAIIFGIVGIKKSRSPIVGGRGMAIAGLVLGIVSLLGWTVMGGFGAYAYRESKPAGAVARQFLQDVVAGNTAAAIANTNGTLATQIQTDTQRFAQYGALQSVSFNSFNFNTINGQTAIHLGGVATFAGGAKICSCDLIKQGSTYKVTAYSVQ